MQVNYARLCQIAVLAAAVSACSSNPKNVIDGATAAGGAAVDAVTDGVNSLANGLTGSNVFSREDLNKPGSVLTQRVVYFGFDSANLNDDQQQILDAHGQYLAAFPEAKVRLEGHTDERGARDYNLALGERRAQSVARSMSLQGAGRDQISTISYGEEQPASFGHNESAWRENRRVVIVYENE